MTKCRARRQVSLIPVHRRRLPDHAIAQRGGLRCSRNIMRVARQGRERFFQLSLRRSDIHAGARYPFSAHRRRAGASRQIFGRAPGRSTVDLSHRHVKPDPAASCFSGGMSRCRMLLKSSVQKGQASKRFASSASFSLERLTSERLQEVQPVCSGRARVSSGGIFGGAAIIS